MPGLVDGSAAASAPRSPGPRRVAALVLPELLCEIAAPAKTNPRAQKRALRHPLGVVLADGSESMATDPNAGIEPSSVLRSVNHAAASLGVRVGQTVTEAQAIAARLSVYRLSLGRVEQELARIAEVAMSFGATVSFAAPDTVWVDVTGSSHLFGGEIALAAELSAKIRHLGHRCRLVIAGGPTLARAMARHAEVGVEGTRIVESPQTLSAVGKLPVHALPIPVALSSFLGRLGLLTLSDLMVLPRSTLAARLGEHAPAVLELLAGQDPAPLVAHVPPARLSEALDWEEPTEGKEPVLFALRRLLTRISGRLSGRGLSATKLELTLDADRASSRFRRSTPQTKLAITLPKPLWREDELFRILQSRVERLVLEAPLVGVELSVVGLAGSLPRQLELSSLLAGSSVTVEDELPLVVAELAQDIGEDRVGFLELSDSHRPERQSRWVPGLLPRKVKKKLRKTRPEPPRSLLRLTPTSTEMTSPGWPDAPTRLLGVPAPIEGPLRCGSTLVVDRRLFTIEKVQFAGRLHAVEWWSQAVSRDYVRLGLRGADGVWEAIAYVDRETGQRFLQGVAS